MTEMLDIYDENMVHIGTKPRIQVHLDGNWHKVFHCWVIYRDDAGDDWVIVQKRGQNKLSCPGLLDVSAAGHYAAGETPQEGIRELHEELGLCAKFEDLIPIGTRITSSRYGAAIDREVADVYLYICAQPIVDYCYQKEEIDGVLALNTSQALALFAGQKESIKAPACGFTTSTVTVTLSHFVSVPDHYWEKIFKLASRCLDKETRLRI